MSPLAYDRPLFAYYGDDFTGSTDVLEALALRGLEAVLFLKAPSATDLERFPDCRAIGVAGDSRSRPPEWMRRELPAIFQCLRDTGAPVVQYKVCSTFDSAPEIGSIGCALEIGRAVFEAPFVPVIAAAPHLERYVVFGNLFAWGVDAIHRIDRHPAMRCHPVTPMAESDLRLHLARQTAARVALLDILALRSPDGTAALDRLLAENPDAILFDGLEKESVIEAARLAWEGAAHFVIGSSGFTAALLEHWRRMGWIPAPPEPPRAEPAERLVVLSGSCSPATARQIAFATRQGFCGIRLEPARLADPAPYLEQAGCALAGGRSVVLYSALGAEDRAAGVDRQQLAERCGRLLGELIARSGVRRVVVAGGDTSSHAIRELPIDALTFHSRLAPGAPLCRAHAARPAFDGLELALKGGQVGPDSFFEDVLTGR